MLHGYALQIEVKFEATSLDERNWVVDFGGLKPFKAWLEYMFDHTLLAASDDPELPIFKSMDDKEVVDLRVLPATGCEAFSEIIYNWLSAWIAQQPEYADRVTVKEVVVREHAGNSGYTRHE